MKELIVIADIAENLGISKENVSFDNINKTYVIAKKADGKPCDILEIKKNNKLEILFIYPLKFVSCNFLEPIFINDKTFQEKIIFRDVIFSKNINLNGNLFLKNIEFSGCFFNKNLSFEKCKLKEKMIFLGINNLKAKFRNTIFEEVYFGKEIDDRNLEKSNSFGSCSFEYTDFSNCHFKNEVYFKNNEFKQVFFRNSKFNDNVYFNNSIFKDYTDFNECEFEKTTSFYGVTFEKTPNFSQVIFKGNLNAINAKLNFTFDDLQQRIKQECTSYESQRTTKKAGVIPNLYQEKSLDKFANDFRDSFRTFKNALIKDNNLLDASNFHKYELYCKEIELKQNWDKKGENVKNTTDLEKNVSRIRDFVDFLLLGFYRKLCDHHTDFLKVFNNLILLISLYILFIFVGSFEFDLEKKSIQNLNKTSDMFSYLTKVKEVIINFSFMQQYYNHILISFVAVCFICLIVIFYKIFKNIKLDFIII
ncbi:TPA: pentapeptide repeat-containing protein, partial [Campylobacter jejuni]